MGLYMVGSTISGFGTDKSDVDMCLVGRATFPHSDVRLEALQQLSDVRSYLDGYTRQSGTGKVLDEPSKMFEDFRLIQAKVPILRFRDKDRQIEVDLNFNNSIGIRNTHLLHCYSQSKLAAT